MAGFHFVLLFSQDFHETFYTNNNALFVTLVYCISKKSTGHLFALKWWRFSVKFEAAWVSYDFVSQSFFFSFFLNSRSNQNHPGASRHGDHCGREHRVTLSGGQWSRPRCVFLLGLQRTTHHQGRQSLWARGRGEWPAFMLLENMWMDSWPPLPILLRFMFELDQRESLWLDIVSAGNLLWPVFTQQSRPQF